jgi:hypothetical protein
MFGLVNSTVTLPKYTDIKSKITILFIIGFILGDGTLHIRLRKSDKGSIWLIPTLLIPQLKNKYSAHFFSILENYLNQ